MTTLLRAQAKHEKRYRPELHESRGASLLLLLDPPAPPAAPPFVPVDLPTPKGKQHPIGLRTFLHWNPVEEAVVSGDPPFIPVHFPNPVLRKPSFTWRDGSQGVPTHLIEPTDLSLPPVVARLPSAAPSFVGTIEVTTVLQGSDSTATLKGSTSRATLKGY
jgi:hypothetical protein